MKEDGLGSPSSDEAVSPAQESRGVPPLIAAVRRFNRIMHFVAGGALVFMLFLTVADIVGRSAFNNPVPGTVEITSLLLIVVVFLAVAHSEDMGDHITIDLIYERVGKRTKLVMDLFSDLLTIAVMGLMSFQLYHFALRNLDTGAETPVLDVPLWPFVFVACFGAGLYTISTVMRLVLRLTGWPVDMVITSDQEVGAVEI